MEFTKEQLIRRAHLTVSRGARELENHPDRDGVAADIKIASIAARALMAEPIYQLWDEGYYDTEKEIYVAALKAGGRGRIVYTAPPAPECLTRPVHPRISSEELDDETLDELIDFRRCTFEYHSQQDNKVQTIIHGVTLTAMIELKERRAAMLQDAENSESHSGIQASPALNFLPKKALSTSCNSQAASCCQCRTCRPVTMTDIRFVVCPECGNKHCPHTNDPRNACTGSNEPRKVARIQQHRSRR